KDLIAAQFVVELSADRFSFRHALTRQAVYTQMLGHERRSLHRAIAETLERLDGGGQHGHLAELAYHTYAAEAWDRALVYARLAGERAQTLHAAREATEQFTRALDAAGHLGLPAPVEVHRARGQSFEMLGDLDRAQADYEAALEGGRSAADIHAEWQALLDLGAFWAARDYARAESHLRAALE